jgi:CspA family cold shock protein
LSWRRGEIPLRKHCAAAFHFIHFLETLMPSGILERYRDDRGYGFIRPDDDDEDLFVHITAFNSAGIFPERGGRYEFEVSERNGKPIAINIRLIDDDSD